MFNHTYRVDCHWSGSTGAGYETYSRAHEAGASASGVRVRLSADPAFRGEAAMLSPEELLVLAAASCQLLSFLAVAARARVDVLQYDDDAEGTMPEDSSPMRLTRIVLRPQIRVGNGTSEERVRHLLEVAHRECYIANSLTTEITVEPSI